MGQPLVAQSPSAGAVARSLLIHLRLPFQLLLAPIFLWGLLLADGRLATGTLLGFVVFHLFLYGGTTAFNSYYDRDEGPVGGLEHPPPVVPALLPFALGIKLVGWLLAALVNWTFFWIYAGFLLLSFAYSHPRVRLKARPLPSLLTVAIGQGVLAFLGAWAAARGEIASAWSWPGVLGALAATLLILGFYPLTQLYQIEEDRARGDRTAAVVWGPRRCFAFVLLCQSVGGAALLAALFQRYGPADALLAGLLLGAQLLAIARWAARFDVRDVFGNYRWVMRLNRLTAAGLSLYLGYRLLGG